MSGIAKVDAVVIFVIQSSSALPVDGPRRLLSRT
jgi:hypothetical protein